MDCRLAVFIFTSNPEASRILPDLDAGATKSNSLVVNVICRRRLREAGIAPELIGRIRCFLAFRALDASHRAEILTLTMRQVAEEYGLQIGRVHPAVVHAPVERGLAGDFGARPEEYLVDEQLRTACC